MIIREGDPVNEHSKFYLIRRGTVEVLRAEDGGAAAEARRDSGPGRYFGEVALLMDQPRNATVRAMDARGGVHGRPRDVRPVTSRVSRPFIDRILENFRAAEGGG